MHQYNSSSEFTFIDFSGSSLLKTMAVIGFLLAYTCTILENAALITVVYTDRSLHTPMYFFLGNFSFIECCFTTTVIPKTLHNLISHNPTIPFSSCVIQMYTFTSLGATECLLLAAMAYDRYIAICYPLHYSLMISIKLCVRLVFCSWFTGFVSPVLPSFFVSRLLFCSDRLDHFFCDFPIVLQLACSSISPTKLSLSFLSSSVLLSSFTVIAVSYSRIVWTVLDMRSSKGVQKAVSTSASHLTVVCIYYVSGFYMYVRPNAYETAATNKYVALLYAILTPMLNPLIYSFRNKDVLMAVRRRNMSIYRFRNKDVLMAVR